MGIKETLPAPDTSESLVFTQTDVDQLPTPLARPALRVVRSKLGEPVERFNSLQYLAEALLKYTAILFHSCLMSLDNDSWRYWGYRLARGDGLGTWEEALIGMEAAARQTKAAGSLRELIDWYAQRRSGKGEVVWFSDSQSKARRLWELVGSGPAEFGPTVRGLFAFLVSFRNKTRGHGALQREFYEAANPLFHALLHSVVQNAWVIRPNLLWCESVPTGLAVRRLRGAVPAEVEHRPDDGVLQRGLIVEFSEEGWGVSCSPLLRYRPGSDACLFANGDWKNGGCEGLDYLTGQCARIDAPEFANPPAPLRRSETAGASLMVADEGAYHNLPGLAYGYVDRKPLEDRLKSLLSDRQHRIITLHGMGGVGKTTLALKAAWDLVRSSACPYELVVWFSARDVDLLVSGPQKRVREVQDIQGIADQYARLLGCPESRLEALQLFADEVGAISNRMLLVMDNFETLDDPQAVHEYLDSTVILPNKVLITSRLRAYKGDYPLEVLGMERAEAEQLLAAEARRAHCEPKMTSETTRRIYDYTSGLPYPMKLVVAQLGRNIPLAQILDASVAEATILDTLFRRSYESLSAQGKRLFLMVGNLGGGAVGTIPLRTVFVAAGYKFDVALDECERSSLVALVQEGNRESVRMPQVARKFAERQLGTAEDGLIIERDLNMIRQTYQDRGNQEEAATAWAIQIGESIATAREQERRSELTKVLEALVSEFPGAWRVVADLRIALHDTPERIREAHHRSLEHDPSDGDLWQSWARFEGSQRNLRREVELLVRAAEQKPNDIGFNSYAANKISYFISSNLTEYPLEERPVWTSTVRTNLENHFEELHAGPLARLGWLYWLESDPWNAERCARRGLQLDPTHEHCLNILRKVQQRSELRARR